MRGSRILGPELSAAEGEGGLELQSDEAQVTCSREGLLSGFLSSLEALLGRHYVGMIK